MQAIGALPGHQGAAATAVSDNGSVVVGTSVAVGPLTRDSLGFVGTGTAFRWTAATGIQDLKQALVAAGADLTGIELVAVTGLSRDGQWISGKATTPASAGQTVAFIVQYCDAAIGAPCRAAGAGSPFLVSAAGTALTVAAGSSASTQITVTPSAGFGGAVTFSCSGLPAGAACSFAPASVTPAGGPVSTTLTITTGGGPVAWRWPGWPGAAVFACAAVFAGVFGRRRERRLPYGAAMLAVLLLAGAALACGGGGGGGGGGSGAGTPAGTSTVTVTATSGAATSSVPLTLTVTR
jgi:hypothetical protein